MSERRPLISWRVFTDWLQSETLAGIAASVVLLPVRSQSTVPAPCELVPEDEIIEKEILIPYVRDNAERVRWFSAGTRFMRRTIGDWKPIALGPSHPSELTRAILVATHSRADILVTSIAIATIGTLA